jgi:integrase
MRRARALAQLLQRERFTAPDDHVFAGIDGRYLGGSALRRRYKAAQTKAKLRPLRFHDLRHSFATLAVTQVESVRELQDWMGHADRHTTARYMHYKQRRGEAARLALAFEPEPADAAEVAS